jgi:DNA-binding transcriptional LysR family regulator
MRQMIESAVQLGDGASARVLDIDGMLGTLELVRNTDWATIAAKIVVDEEVREGKLDAQPIGNPELWLDLFLVQVKSVSLPAACRDFLQRLKQTLERIPSA